ncbi:hypothetical protein D8S78_18445 [Natrialba swarupiae]|nr:hypothetical protein [Natrialba swarupiae]
MPRRRDNATAVSRKDSRTIVSAETPIGVYSVSIATVYTVNTAGLGTLGVLEQPYHGYPFTSG